VQFFTKLDLQSGYQQVLMRPDNVMKTLFRNHQSLFRVPSHVVRVDERTDHIPDIDE
jgi:hypothetical protein